MSFTRKENIDTKEKDKKNWKRKSISAQIFSEERIEKRKRKRRRNKENIYER